MITNQETDVLIVLHSNGGDKLHPTCRPQHLLAMHELAQGLQSISKQTKGKHGGREVLLVCTTLARVQLTTDIWSSGSDTVTT